MVDFTVVVVGMLNETGIKIVVATLWMLMQRAVEWVIHEEESWPCC